MGGTFTRASVATYIDGNGVVQYAPMNLLTYSEDFSNGAWSATSTTATTGVSDPNSGNTAATITATGANGTFVQSVVAAMPALPAVHSLWIRRRTGTGAIQLLRPDAGAYDTVTVTSTWTRFTSVVATITANQWGGIKIVTSGDAVDIAFAQTELAPAATAYQKTTTAAVYAPRYQHVDPANPTLGQTLLLEGSRQNLFNYSSDYSNAYWTKGNVTLGASVVAPDGTTTGNLVLEVAVVAAHDIARTLAGYTDNTAQSFSFFAKLHSRTYVWIETDTKAGATPASWVNLSTGAIGTKAATHTITVTAVSGGWWKITCILSSAGVGAAGQAVYVGCTDADNTQSYAGDIAKGFYLWGMQAEINTAFPSSYIPTTSAAVTRAADALSFPFLPVPQAMTVYADFVEIGNMIAASGAGVFAIGRSTNEAIFADGGATYETVHRVAGDVSSVAAATPAYGNHVELRVLANPNGSVALGQSINGATEVVAATSAGNAFGASFSFAELMVNGRTAAGSTVGFLALRSLKIAAQIQSLDVMRAL